ncbi:MAG: DUF4347 domain-containing protein [Gemmataceae bacterium]
MMSREDIVAVVERAFGRNQFWPDRTENRIAKLFRRPRSRLRLEQCEDRALASANPVASIFDTSTRALMAPPLFEQPTISILPASKSIVTTRHELVFIDSRVADWRDLVRDLQNQTSEVRQIDFVMLSPSRDGIGQVSEALAKYRDLDAVHFVTHGNSTGVQLGATWLDQQTLAAQSRDVAGWSGSLKADADLLFYGCDLASGSEGRVLLETIHALTGADVAASTDLTGSAALGGNWTFEFTDGLVQTPVVFSAAVQRGWNGVLGHVSQFNTWSPTVAGSWQTTDLNAAFGVPANAVVEIAISNSDSGTAQTGGVRAVGSSLNRSFLINKEQAGQESVELLVQADSSGQIQTFASDTTQISFKLLGYWTNGAYVETSGSFTATAANAWQSHGLSAYGVGANQVAEIVITNNSNNSPQAGVRTEGSSLNRIVDLRNLDGGSGPGTMTMLVKTGNTGAANIEAYSEQTANVTFNVVGYWSTTPGSYFEAFANIGTPSINSTWQSKNLSAYGVPANAVVDITFTNEETNNSNSGGIRNLGSSDNRLLNLNPFGSGATGGPDNARMFATVTNNSNSTIEWYHDNISAANFYLTGYFLTDNAPVLDPSKSPVLTAIIEDAGVPTGAVGSLISSLVDFSVPVGQVDNVSDVDSDALLGVAITAADTTNGSWWYTTNKGSSWNALGSVADSSARLLAADANTRIYFQPSSNYNGSLPAAITFRAWDQFLGTNGTLADSSVNGGATPFSTATDTASLVVISVNDAPSGTNKTVTALEDNAYIFAASEFGFSDPNDSPANNLLAIKLTSLPGAGTLTDNGLAVATNQFISLADINAGLLKFMPGADGNGAGYASFTFAVQDDGGTANGGVDLDPTPNTITIDVTSVNDAPPGADKTVTTLEDTAYAFKASDFGFTDANDSPANKLLSVKITALPAVGNLTDNGIAVAKDQFIPIADINGGLLKYTPGADANGAGYASLTFAVQDDGGTANGGVDLDPTPNTITVNVTSVNDAPGGTNKTVTATEDITYVFSAGDFGFTDSKDSPANSLSFVKITSLPGAGSLTDNGIAVAKDQFVPVADINGGLLKFTPVANAQGSGYASFTFAVQDNGGTANGGVDLDPTPNTITIDVTSVNDAPAGADKTVTTLEDTAYVFAASDFGFTDPSDSPANSLLSVKITSLPGVGSFTDNGAAVTLNQFVSIADINGGLLKYAPVANNNGAGYANFTFAVRDDGGTANGGSDLDPTPNTMTINVTLVNDAPAGADKTISALEDVAYVFSASDFGFTDTNDSPANSLLSVKITSLPAAGTFTDNGAAVTLNQFVTVADINAGLLKYTGAPNANGANYANFKFAVRDDGGTANGGIDLDATPNTITLNVTSVNDAPGGTNKTLTAFEDTSYVFSTSDFGFTDSSDSPANSLLAVKITTLPAIGTFTDNGIAVVKNQFVSVADINAGLLKYTGASNANGAGYASFTFAVQDDGGTANGGIDLDATPNTITIDVTSVNDAPGGTNKTVTTLEDTAYVFAASDFGFTDPNDSPANSLLSVKITSLPGLGTLTDNGAAVTLNQFVTVADINAGLLKYAPAANGNGAGYANFNFAVQDDGGTANGGIDLDPTSNTITISVTSVNDAPGGTNKTVTALEDTVYVFSASDFGFTDTSDSPANNLLSVKITSLPAAGTFIDNGAAVTLNQFVSVADITGGLLQFASAANANGAGYSSFTFAVRDDGGTANGGIDLDPTPNTLTIDVTAVNDAPVNSVPASQDTAKNATLVFSAANGNPITVSDIDAGAAQVQVTLTATNGTITLPSLVGLTFTVGDGTADPTMTFKATIANINADLNGLKFIPTANFVGIGNLQIATNDLGNTGGAALTTTDNVTVEMVVEFRANTTIANNQTEPAAAFSKADNFVVVWTSDGNLDGNARGVFGQLYDWNGNPIGTEFGVNTFIAGDQNRPAVAMDYAGNFVVVWVSNNQDGSGHGIYAQRYGSSGVPVGTEFLVNVTTAGQQDVAAVAMDGNGNFVVTWRSDRGGIGTDIYARRYNSAGVAQGGEFLVNTNLTNNQDLPTVAMDANGNFVIAWKSNKQDGSGAGIFGQRYNSAGTALGGEFQINTTNSGNQDKPTAAMDANGNFVVAWVSGNDQDGDKNGVYAQRFNAAGAALGTEFRVNTTTADSQDRPSIGMDNTGAFTIAWASNTQDGNGKGIYAQRYDANGNMVGAEFRVSSTTSGNQDVPAVAVSGIGDLVVTWQGNGLGDSSGVFGQLYQSVNDAPVNSVPVAQSTNEDTALVFSSANGNLVSISDVDAYNHAVQVTLAATNGTLTLSGIAGLTFTTGDGTADAAMTFTGSITSINAALAGMSFLPSADFNGAASLQIITNDQGNTGTGGALSDTDTVNITVVAVNDAPVNNVPGAQATRDGTALVFSNPNGNKISISDVDVSGSNTVKVTLTATNGTMTLSGTAGLTFITGDGTADGTMTFTGKINSVNNALNGMSFLPTANVAGNGSIQIVTDDQGNTGLGGAKTDTDSVPITIYGFVVTPTSGLVTTEASGTASYTVALRSAPSANVQTAVGSNNAAEGIAGPGTLTFTPANWSTPQTVTVTGVDDSIDDGDQGYTIILGVATSTDGNYSGMDPVDVAATNIDDDTAGITVAPTSGLTTTEAGGTAKFTVVLNSQPLANVTISVASSNTFEGTVSTALLTFTAGNWNVAQTVTVTGVDDFVDDGDQGYTVILGKASSTDGNYKNVDPADVTLTNIDNDTAGVTVSPTSGLVTTEAGGTASFTVVLTSQPTAKVTIPVSSSNVAEGTVSTASLVFTAANWNVAQTVTVTGIDDSVDDGDQGYTVVLGVVTSTDANYSGQNPADVSVTNKNDDTAGFNVSPTSGLVTTEKGVTATFSVQLTSKPLANVTFNVTSSDTGEGTVSVSSLTFTPANWNVGQTVTITGVDDPDPDGNIPYTIILSPATSTDGKYSGNNPADVSVTNIDDYQATVIVAPPSGLVTTEAGGKATFTVVLTSNPVSNVTFNVASSNPAEGKTNVSSLTFTSANWNVDQTVTLTGVDDFINDGDQGYSIIISPGVSGAKYYNGIDPIDPTVTNIDDDKAGTTASPTSGLTTTEAGAKASFTVVLTSQPTGSVTIPVSSSNPAEGTVSAASLVFLASNWNVPQTVTVTGIDEFVDDGDQAYTIVLGAASSTDVKYNAMNPADVSVTNIDDDTVGIIVSPTSGLVTTEAGGKATFSVVLNSQPTANVTISVSSSNTAEGTVSTAALTFTAANWNVAQTVTVAGVDDLIDDDDQVYTIILAKAVSGDAKYSGMDPADVSVTNTDDDTAGVIVSPTSGLVTTEAGGKATFTVVLTSQPTAKVTIPISSSIPGEGSVSAGSLIFTGANWNVAQTITVTGVDDSIADGTRAYTIVVGAVTSTDGKYNGMDPADVSATNTDDEVPGFVVSPTSGLVTTESGGTAAFTVRLSVQPSANVTIPLSSNDLTEGTVNLASLTFTPANWNIPQTVTLTGQDEFTADGDQPYTIILGAASSPGTPYNGVDPADVSATNLDDDVPGVSVSKTSGLITTEAGGTDSFSIRLNSDPVSDATITLSVSKAGEASLSSYTLVFHHGGDWKTPHVVTVTGLDDSVVDGDQPYTIISSKVISGDPKYSGLQPPDITAVNQDDEVAGFVVSPTSGLTTTEAGGTATFTVTLAAQPVSNVTIPLSVSNPGEGKLSAASLTFTPANWNTAQTVTVTGVDDFIDDINQPYTVVLGVASSPGNPYDGLNPPDVSVTNLNDDTVGITVSPTSGLVTTEAKGKASFDVVLNSQPTANVTIAVSTSDASEGTVSTASLTFTAANWNVPQTVTVIGVDDFVDDDDQAYTIILGKSVSGDAKYSVIDPADVSVTNTDDDTAGITVAPTSGLVTTEAGGKATFTVVLNSQPTANVTIAVSSNNIAEGTVNKPSLTFTAANWNIAQTVTLTGVNDFVADGNQNYSIVLGAATSTDGKYSGIDPSDVSATNKDDDVVGITVSPTSGLVTTEAGGKATFTVVLTSQPTANVIVPISSSDPAEGTVSSPSLTFTPANWKVPQTITITGVDDFVDDGDQAYTVILGTALSSDGKYNGLDPADVSVTNTDDDTVGVIVSPTVGLVTTEAGGQDTFSVTLASQPTGDVTIGISTSNGAEGSANPISLVFTPVNWKTPQIVTVTGADDFVDDGDQPYAIVLAPATSGDAKYDGLNASNVSVTNVDDDVAGYVVSPMAGLMTTEAGGTATFTVVLTSQPTANVTVPVSVSNAAEGSVSTASLTFTAANWNVPQTVTVTGVDEFIDDGDQAYTVILGGAASTDGKYNGLKPADVSVTNTDDDTVGIIVSPTSGLITTEAGGKATFNVVLNSQPTANVTIAVSTSDASEGTVSTASLTFTAADWNVPQTVTVTGVDDFVDDDDQAYTIVLGKAVSGDAKYSVIDPADVSVTNTNDDTAGITVAPTSGLVTTEAGGKATFTVVLNSQPTANVTIAVSSADPGEGTASTASLTFTAANWNVAQTVTLTGVDEFIADGDQPYTIILAPATSVDPKYSGIDPADVSATNKDNDVVGITVSPVAGLVTTEGGGTATFTVVLTSQPIANVTIPVSSTNVGEGTVSTASLTFTAANWNVPQTITITGIDEFIDDGDQAYTIVLAPATSGDAKYNGLDASDVSATNKNDDVVGINVAPIAGLNTTEAGGKAQFKVTLNSQPLANVVIPVSSSNIAEGKVNVASLTFTPANWNVPQTVTITGVDDFVDDGDQAYTIVLGAAASGDAKYSGIDPADVSVTNLDDDVAGFTVTPTAGLVTTEAGGSDQFTVALTSQPTANVTIGVSVSNPAEGSLNVASLTFTAANWNIPQTITVAGVDEFIDDGDQVYTIILAPGKSADGKYQGVDPSDVTATNIDNDTAGVNVSPTSGLVTTEAGGTDQFTVVLNSQPTGNVTIPVSSSNSAEGKVSVASLIFTPANWNVPQTVTVTGVDDFVDDGDQVYNIVLGNASSTDGNYKNFDPADVSVTNLDDDVAGITVAPTAGLVTTEAGGTDQFSVVLNTQPTGKVVIPISVSAPGEASLSIGSLTFTPANWSTPQFITVTGVDDFVDDGDQAYTIIVGAAASKDGKYNGTDANDVSATNLDDDTAGIFVSPTAGLITTEAGGTDQFTVVLTSQPTGNVTISMNSNNLGEGTISTASLVFTPANWNVAQTVTVTGIDDLIDDGSRAYTIVLAPAKSPDGKYQNLDATDVSATNLNDDTAGITVSPTSGLVTTEAGGSDKFTVVLTSQPVANLTVNVSVSRPDEGVTNVASVTFTSANWNIPQTITVTGVDDFLDDGDQPYTIILSAATSTDGKYNGMDPADVSATNTDDDKAGINLVAPAKLLTTEAGGYATFTLVLTSQPYGDVTIPVVSSNPNEGRPASASVIFTPQNWNQVQTVVINGIDDDYADSDVVYTVFVGSAQSNDFGYDTMSIPSIPALNLDNDHAGILVNAPPVLQLTESGRSEGFFVSLSSKPYSSVILLLNSTNPAKGVLDVSAVVITPSDWNIPHPVVVTGVDNFVADGATSFQITFDPAISGDFGYYNMPPNAINAVTDDNDVAGIRVLPGNSVILGGADNTGIVQIVLLSEPIAPVTMQLTSSAPDLVEVLTTTVSFTPADWFVPHFVQLHGLSPQALADVAVASTSSDVNYLNLVRTVTVASSAVAADPLANYRPPGPTYTPQAGSTTPEGPGGHSGNSGSGSGSSKDPLTGAFGGGTTGAGGDPSFDPSNSDASQSSSPSQLPLPSREQMRVEMSWLPPPSHPLLAGRGLGSFQYEPMNESIEKLGQDLRGEHATRTAVARTTLGSAVVVSAGYVLWSLRGAAWLASAVASTTPAWSALDPLVFLAARRRDDEEDESLESMVDTANRPKTATSQKRLG